jgi:hypothetical protein
MIFAAFAVVAKLAQQNSTQSVYTLTTNYFHLKSLEAALWGKKALECC